MAEKVSLQINLSPSDYPVARWVLPHQIKRLASQVDEIVLTLESRPSGGRFSEGWDENRDKIQKFISSVISTDLKIRVSEVDYDDTKNMEIAHRYFLANHIPFKDFRGGPFYSYFFGLSECQYDYVLHLDSDILLGGGDDQWVRSAVETLQKDPQIFCCSPLPGPPSIGGDVYQTTLRSDPVRREYEFNSFSTRIFFVDRRRFGEHKLKLSRPSVKSIVMAALDGNDWSELPEVLITGMMRRENLRRLDFLGAGAGLWSLHPPFKGARFFARLPELIDAVERDEIPEGQRGHYDIRAEFYDFSSEREALKHNRWWRRLFRRVVSAAN